MRTRPGTPVPALPALVPALLALVLAAPPVGAQDATVRAFVDTTRITVGDRIHMTVTVDHAPGSRVAWPDSLDLAPFEVLEARADAPAAQGGRVVSRAMLTLTSFELGNLEIPSLALDVEGADGNETVRTDPFGVEVVSVGLDEGDDIRGILGPLAIPLSPARVGVGLAALLLAVMAALWLFRRFRRKGDREPEGPAAPPRPPHEVALEALDALGRSSFLREGKVKEFHIALSEILRRYVEDRFRVRALEMTTREIRTGLASSSAPEAFAAGLGPVLDRCDLVKFAKVRPPTESALTLLDDGRGLVRSTIPHPREGAGPAAGHGHNAPADGQPVLAGAVARGVAGASAGAVAPAVADGAAAEGSPREEPG